MICMVPELAVNQLITTCCGSNKTYLFSAILWAKKPSTMPRPCLQKKVIGSWPGLGLVLYMVREVAVNQLWISWLPRVFKLNSLVQRHILWAKSQQQMPRPCLLKKVIRKLARCCRNFKKRPSVNKWKNKQWAFWKFAWAPWFFLEALTCIVRDRCRDEGQAHMSRARICKRFSSPGIDSASLCSLVGRTRICKPF